MIKKEAGITQIVLIIILVIGLIALVIFVQRQQIFKSKATSTFTQGLEMQDANNNTVICNSEDKPVCTTKTAKIKIKVKDLNTLVN